MNIQEKISWLQEWCDKRRLTLDLEEGTAGFGRPCVGISEPASQAWLDVDYEEPWDEEPEEGVNWFPQLEPPEHVHAYHKHPCLCVLGRGDESISGLYDWVRALDAIGVEVRTVERIYSSMEDNMISRMLHGPTRTMLVPNTALSGKRA